MWSSFILTIVSMVALNGELDRSSHTLTSLLFDTQSKTQQFFTAVIFSFYLSVIAWCCTSDMKYQSVPTYCVASLSILSSFILWEDLVFNSTAPPFVLCLIAYNSLGVMFCICIVNWLVYNGRPATKCIIALWLAVAHVMYFQMGPGIQEVHHKSSLNRIVIQLSDLHIGPTCRRECTAAIVKTALRARRPDLFVITGDVIDGRAEIYSEAAEPLRLLHSYAPTIMITGNHDHLHGDVDNVIKLMKSFGIIVLRNEAMNVKGLRVVGIDDEKPNVTASLLQGSHLVLVHQPTIAKTILSLFNDGVVLAGHTHCGQMLPILPVVWLNNYPYFCGLYGKLYVSSGSGNWGPGMRLGYR
jgi:predicted MPP superfamily phosphohydrolase